MTMVLAIHATGTYEYRFIASHDFLSQDFLAVFLNQLARFSVPVFVTLSGFGLTMKYGLLTTKNGKSLDQITVPWSFYGERLYKIGLPFLFWSVLYLAIQGYLKGPYNWQWIMDLLPFLYRKGADYHFYFFHIIFECYLLFPLLAWAFARLKKLRLPVLLLSLLLQLYVSSPAHIWFDDFPRIPFVFSAFFLYWQFPFILGIYFAFLNLESSSPQEKSNKNADGIPVKRASEGKSATLLRKESNLDGPVLSRKSILSLTLLFCLVTFTVVMTEFIFWSYNSQSPGDFNHFTRMSVVFYSGAFFLMFYFWPSSNGKTEENSYSGWERNVSYLAGLSFFVYIVHTWILRGLELLLPQWLLPILLLLIFISFLLAALLDRIVRPTHLRTMLGLEKRKG